MTIQSEGQIARTDREKARAWARELLDQFRKLRERRRGGKVDAA